METIRCPHCERDNPVGADRCQFCNQPLRNEEPLKPLRLDTVVPFSAPSASATPAEEAEQLPPLPETPVESALENGTLPLAERYACDGRYNTVNGALAAYADAFVVSQSGGRQMILRETAKKKLISAAVFGLAVFITLSLMMLYHRGYFLFLLLFAVLGVIYFFRSVTNEDLLAKRLESMPAADMESVLISDIDRMVPQKTVSALQLGIFAVFLALFVAAFWTPRVIFESSGDGTSALRFYSSAFRPVHDVVLPDTWNGKTVTEIRGNVFEGLRSIQTVKLPGRLVSIRAHAFRRCANLRAVDFPSTIRSIGSSAFRDCPKLTHVTLPSQCDVNSRAFKDSGTSIERK